MLQSEVFQSLDGVTSCIACVVPHLVKRFPLTRATGRLKEGAKAEGMNELKFLPPSPLSTTNLKDASHSMSVIHSPLDVSSRQPRSRMAKCLWRVGQNKHMRVGLYNVMWMNEGEKNREENRATKKKKARKCRRTSEKNMAKRQIYNKEEGPAVLTSSVVPAYTGRNTQCSKAVYAFDCLHHDICKIHSLPSPVEQFSGSGRRQSLLERF